MIYPEAFGLEDDKETLNMLLKEALYNPTKTFEGYSGVYFYRNFGYMEVIANTKFEGDKLQVKGYSAHAIGNKYLTVVIDKQLKHEEMEMTCMCRPMLDTSLSIPIVFVMSDVLPSFMHGDIVAMQCMGFGVKGHIGFYKTAEEAKTALGLSEKARKADLKDGFIFPGSGDGSLSNIFFAKARNFRIKRGFTDGDRTYIYPVYLFDISTTFGDLTIVVPPSYFKDHPEELKMLKEGAELYASGLFYLSGDVAVWDYQRGRIIDEEHLLRVFKSAEEDGSFDRLSRYIAEDCEYMGNQPCDRGKNAILEKLKFVYDYISKHEENKFYGFMGSISKVLDPDEVKYSPRKRIMLIRVGKEDGFRQSCAIELNDEKKIKRLYFNSSARSFFFELDKTPFENFQPTDLAIKSTDEWKEYFNDWIRGNIASRKHELFNGMERTSALSLGDEFYYERNASYAKLSELLSEIASYRLPFDVDDIEIEFSDHGLIRFITIGKIPSF